MPLVLVALGLGVIVLLATSKGGAAPAAPPVPYPGPAPAPTGFLAPITDAATVLQYQTAVAASIGAGISMGFAEALSDNGSLTGRGAPWIRGAICGLMTTLGGIGHTLPFLIPNLKTAVAVAVVVVLVELSVISWVRHKYMDTPLVSALLQVALGGALVFLAGILIGNS